MLIIDAHLDHSLNAIQFNRDLLEPVHVIRILERDVPGKSRANNTVAFPDMRRGRVGLCIATLLARSTGRAVPNIDYPSPTQAYGMAHGQLAYYRALERLGHVRIIEELSALDSHMGEWETWDAQPAADPETAPPLGFVLSMEGADPILEPEQLDYWWGVGLRLLGLTHYGPGRYAGGTGVSSGLTELGRAILPEMERLGVLLDLTHSSDRSFWESLELYDGPVLASHNNCRALVPHQRQFDDAQLQAIFQRDGVIGAAFDAWMLQPGWKVGETTNENVTLETVADHIDYICQLAGSARHAAIGTDLDGGFGREQSPNDLDTIADLQKLVGILENRGYSKEDVAAIMHGNWLRFLRGAWREA